MATEDTEIYQRLSRLEQEIHTLKFRAETLDSHNLPIRVANLEPVVKNIGSDVAKIESNMEEMKEVMTSGVSGVKADIASIKSWGKGVAITLSAIVVIINLLPVLKGFFQ